MDNNGRIWTAMDEYGRIWTHTREWRRDKGTRAADTGTWGLPEIEEFPGGGVGL